MSNILDHRLIEAGYFLSRLGVKEPPKQLNSDSWKEAYAKFYGTLGGNKSEEEFKNSLKNLRDHFDSHINNSRTGWMEKRSKPQKLSSLNQEVFNQLQKLSDIELWKRIKPLVVTSYNAKVALKKNNQIKEGGAKYFSSEFSGKKKTSGRSDGEAIVFHGFVVDFLKEYIEQKKLGSLTYNTQKIDLAVETGGVLTDIFEVKTSNDTQSIYTAVGQLFMHSVGLHNVTKYIVLPDSSDNIELIECLSLLNIEIIWFVIDNETCKFKLNKKIKLTV